MQPYNEYQRMLTFPSALASGKKSMEQVCPSAPWQASALELLVFYCFYILHIPLHYSKDYHVRGTCPIPLGIDYCFIIQINGKSVIKTYSSVFYILYNAVS